MKFPLYAMRSYIDTFEEGDYIIIQTARTRWVLDYKYKTEESYWKRRLKLKTDKYAPYKLYPLKKKFTTYSQVINYKFNKFIDSTGRVITYVPEQFYPVKYEKILVKWKTTKGHTAVRTAKCPTTFIIEDYGYTHLGYIKAGRRFILYDLCMEKKPDTRKKI